MQPNFKLLFVATLLLLNITSCNDSGDDWKLAKTISLGAVSMSVPETYDYTNRTNEKVEVSNGFDGNSVAIMMEDIAGRSQDSIFNQKSANYPYPGDYIISDTTLLGRPTLKIETTIIVAYNLGGEHSIVSYFFLEDGKVYTIEYAWSKDYYTQSKNLMYEMLASLQIR